MTRGLRVPLVVRLMLALVGVAGFSTTLALTLQEHTLSADLERAAWIRLEAAGRAAGRLVELHTQATADRYRAIAGTPQFRATLEVDDAPTLAHYAEELARGQGAARILFLDAAGNAIAGAGDAQVDPASLGSADGASLIARHGRIFVLVGLSLKTGGRKVGRLLAAETLTPKIIHEWSHLCGARVLFRAEEPGATFLTLPVLDLRNIGMHVRISVAPERRALSNARRHLLAAGTTGLLVAILVSLVWSRWLARVVRSITAAAERIGRGDFDVRIASARHDEIGDVARAVDNMATRLAASREVQQRLEENLRSRSERLEMMNQELQEMNRLKSEFLSTVSHELRTPLNVILGYTEMLTDGGVGELTAPQREILVAISQYSHLQLALVTSVLDFERLSSGNITLQIERFELRSLVEDVCRIDGERRRRATVPLAVTLAPEIGVLETDRLKLLEVINNLVENATKFTERGSIRIEARTGPDPGWVTIAIVDTGTGIAPEDQSTIFSEFRQLGEHATSNTGGLGLGLAIVKRLVDVLGGRIAVESLPGRGSTFRVALPMRLLPPAERATSSAAAA
jgi:signal transduction histidine kinase